MQFHRVVVGVDFSAASLAAARWVATQLAPRAELVLVHVLPEPEAPSFVRPYLPSMLEIVAELAPPLLGGLRGVAELVNAGRTRVDMRAGLPADGLARAAAEVGADLICVGRTHSRRGSARFGATTAQRLLARTGLPVVVVPAAPAAPGAQRPAVAPPARILAAVDARASASCLVQAAWRLALACEARLDALHVLGPALHALVRASCPAEADPGSTPPAPADAGGLGPSSFDERTLFGLTREWLEGQLDAAGAAPARARATVRVGDPGQEIVAFAHAAGVDLITVGRGGDWADPPPAAAAKAAVPCALPLGSTARLVMWAAPCPVLVLPAAPPPRDPAPTTRWGARQRQAPAPRSGATRAPSPSPGPLPPAAAHRERDAAPGRGAHREEDAA